MAGKRPDVEEMADYAARLDELVPDWYEDDETLMTGALAAEALKRRDR